jgi:hypothetical protein
MIAIDPGPENSAYVVMTDGRIEKFGIVPTMQLVDTLSKVPNHSQLAVIEMIASYGMPVGAEVFDTCVKIGMMIEANARNCELMFRREVKMHLCGSNAAKDSNIRQALIDKYGPGKEKAIGLKKTPGPLFGVSKDVWAALGVAVTWTENNGGVIRCGTNTGKTDEQS